MTDPERERMSEAEIDSVLASMDEGCECHGPMGYVVTVACGARKCMACEVKATITQLQSDLAAMTERAEKAEAECVANHEAFGEQSERLAELSIKNDILRKQLDAAREGLWKPASEHPDEFEDGDAYLVRIPVINQRLNHEYMDYYIIRASCDSETPLSWNDQHGNHWCEWDWEDVEAYIKLDTLAQIAGKEADDEASCPKYLDITALHELAKSCPGGVGIEALRYAMDQSSPSA